MLKNSCMINSKLCSFNIGYFFKLMFVYRTTVGNQWLSKEDLEKLTVENISEHDVKKINKYYINY